MQTCRSVQGRTAFACTENAVAERFVERLLSRVESANLANRAKTEFISQAAHDIRTPLNAIIAMTDNALTADIQNCLNAGMNVHLSKPVDMAELL